MCCCFMGNEEEVDQAMMMKNEKEKNATRSTIRRVESASLRALKMFSRRRRNARALQTKKMSNVEWWSQMVSKRKQQKCGWNEIRELFKLRGGGEEQVADGDD